MWTDAYIGLPYTQYNCAALLKLVWAKELNLTLDIDTNCSDNTIYSGLMVREAAKLVKMDVPIDKCAVLMYSRSGLIGHVGIWLDYKDGYILHAHKDFESSILQKASDVFNLNRLEGFYHVKKNNS